MARTGGLRVRWLAAALAAVSGLGALIGATGPAAARPAAHWHASVDPALAARYGDVRVIVQALPGTEAAAAAATARLGGHLTRPLQLIHGFAATLPSRAVQQLAGVAGVRAISFDATLHVQGTVSADGGPASVYRHETGADSLAGAGATGSGVTVALIDTGVTPSSELAGRLVPVGLDQCVNFSGDPGCTDHYGHGTFLAGLIAGNGAASGGVYAGVAPDAKILSVKLAGRNGAADVSQILAAIQWVVSFRDTYNIKVLNLSLGTDSTQSYRVDPLNYAVEQAWFSGITVVVSASNRGPDPETISKPGDDPYVITVGAVDDLGTNGIGDDSLPNFSSHGPTAADGLAKPDLVAPGAHLISLNAAGSAVADNFPTSMPAPYRRGSGTSMSTAVVSGIVAQMLSADPSLTPDRIKYALTATARGVASTDPMAVGAGMVDAYAATYKAPPGLANQGLAPGDGTGSLQLSRGTVDVTVDGTTPLLGDTTAQLQLWVPLLYIGVPWNPLTWLNSQWVGNNWYGNNWYENDWSGNNWYGNNWYGDFNGNNWYGNNWYGSAWYGAWDN